MVRKAAKRISAWIRRHRDKYVCQCGCGEFIEIKHEHYYSGIPSFIKGHNLGEGGMAAALPQSNSFWDRLSEEEQERRLSQLKSFPSGEEHPNWAGGIHITEAGYRLIRTPAHPFAKDGYVAEHRLLVEAWMRENAPNHGAMCKVDGVPYLNRSTVVHHRDEIKDHNVLGNLILMKDQGTHLAWHMKNVGELEKFVLYSDEIFCPWIVDNGENNSENPYREEV